MTTWNPDLAGASGPVYLALADALARDVACGRLLPGSRLPTHRALADRLGVTVGTVSRAYAEAQRRGLLSGEVGRGTFVRAQEPPRMIDFRESGAGTEDLIDLSHNAPETSTAARSLAPHFAALSQEGDLASLLAYQHNAGLLAHRRAGARWLARFGLTASPQEILVTAGGQHGILLALSVLAKAGDLVLAESLTYPGMKALARLLGLRVVGAPMDAEGILPGALEDLCQRLRPRALYTTPTLQNPTGTVMPPGRRKEIAAIVERQGILLIEDDTYAFLLDAPPPPIASFAPRSSIYLTGLSKSTAPALRTGFLVAPPALREALTAAVMASTIMASPLTAEVASRVIGDGTAELLARALRQETAARQRLAQRALTRHIDPACHPASMHLWLNLPEPWRVEELVAQSRARGVIVASSELFAVGRSAAPHAVRLSLCAPPDRRTLERALSVIAGLLESPPPPSRTAL